MNDTPDKENKLAYLDALIEAAKPFAAVLNHFNVREAAARLSPANWHDISAAIKPFLDAKNVCKHGHLARVCEMCEAADRIAELERELAAAKAEDEWIHCSERLPKSGVKVLVAWKNSHGLWHRTCAHYAAKHTVDASFWEEGETDDTEDGSYEPEGWWEEPVEIERVELITEEVRFWRPLPELPK